MASSAIFFSNSFFAFLISDVTLFLSLTYSLYLTAVEQATYRLQARDFLLIILSNLLFIQTGFTFLVSVFFLFGIHSSYNLYIMFIYIIHISSTLLHFLNSLTQFIFVSSSDIHL